MGRYPDVRPGVDDQRGAMARLKCVLMPGEDILADALEFLAIPDGEAVTRARDERSLVGIVAHGRVNAPASADPA